MLFEHRYIEAGVQRLNSIIEENEGLSRGNSDGNSDGFRENEPANQACFGICVF